MSSNEKDKQFLGKKDVKSQVIMTSIFMVFFFGSKSIAEDNFMLQLPIIMMGGVLAYGTAYLVHKKSK